MVKAEYTRLREPGVPYRPRTILAALTLANMSNFWMRNLVYSLASAYPRECLSTCDGAVFVPLCSSCGDAKGLSSEAEVAACSACQSCRSRHGAEFYSLRDAACMSDREYGLLASVSFTVMFALSGVVAGTIADRFRASRLLHAGAVLTWSLAGFAKVAYPSFGVLVASRLVLGVAQGFNAPCAYPVIVHTFRARERAFANGVYSVGTYLGSALASLSLVAAMAVGWRTATVAASVTGIFAAAMIHLVVERPPPDTAVVSFLGRQSANTLLFSLSGEADEASTQRAVVAPVVARRKAVLYVATSIRMLVTFTTWTYLPSYVARAFPTRVAAFSVLYAAGTLVLGSTSSALGGAAADKANLKRGFGRGRGNVGHAVVPLVGTLVGAILMLAALYASDFATALALAVLAIFAGECWLGPCMTLLARDVEPTTMGTRVAVLLVCNQLTACLGPWFISLVDDGTASGLRRPFVAVLTLGSLLSALGFLGLASLHRPDRRAYLSSGSRGPPSGSVFDLPADDGLCLEPLSSSSNSGALLRHSDASPDLSPGPRHSRLRSSEEPVEPVDERHSLLDPPSAAVKQAAAYLT